MTTSSLDSTSDVVLLVEDNPDHAELIQRMFEMNHIPNPICHLSDGQIALEYLFRENTYVDPGTSPRPCLVLLDLRLPKINGLEVLKRVKERKEFEVLPVIILSTSETNVDMEKAYAIGANGYLVKPMELSQFSQVTQYLGQFGLKGNQGSQQIGGLLDPPKNL